MIDLHFHSSFSDGDLQPVELAHAAAERGLYAAALTDHDTVDGVQAFVDAAREAGLKAVGGLEISADWRPGTLHMLGYGIDPEHKALNDALAWMRGGREERNIEILHKLAELNCPLTLEEVRAEIGEQVIGRPHIALAMVKKGYVKNKEQAFKRYLSKGSKAYIDRRRLSPKDSIECIRAAGGAPVLAHPVTLGLSHTKLRAAVQELKALGLAGLEVYYPEHSPKQVDKLRNLALEEGLLMTGGSDFHGRLNPAVSLGTGFGPLKTPNACFDALEAWLESHQKNSRNNPAAAR